MASTAAGAPGEQRRRPRRSEVLAGRLRERFGWDRPAEGGPGPALIVLSGLPGTGKSYLAAAIARRHRVLVLRSDEVRKATFERPQYTPRESGLVYLTCYALIEQLLRDGYAVVFDATNLQRRGRKRLRTIAERAGAPSLTIVTVAPPHVVAERMAQRVAGEAEAYGSDADWTIHQRLAATAEAVNEPAVVVDTSQDIAPALEAVDRLLLDA